MHSGLAGGHTKNCKSYSVGHMSESTVELPYSKLGPSQQKVYYKEVFYYKEVSKFPLFSWKYGNKVHKHNFNYSKRHIIGPLKMCLFC